MNAVQFYAKRFGNVFKGLFNYFFGPSVPLTPAKIKAYLNCPKRFFLDNVAKDKIKDDYLEVENPYEDDSSTLQYNISLKNAIGMAFSLMRKGETIAENDLLNIFSRKYHSSARYETERELEEKGKDRLLKFHRWYTAAFGKPLETDRRIYVNIDNIRVRSIVDIIDRSGEDIRLIVLKPTGRVNDKRILAFYDYGMMLNYVYAKEHYKKNFNKIIVYYFEDSVPVEFDLRNEEDIKLLKKGFNNVRRTIKYVNSSIRNRKFEPEKGVLCHKCPYFYTCEAWATVPKEVKDQLIDTSRERLSYSKMSSYLNCPRAFKFNYIDKIPQKPRPFFSFGTSIHETFEEFYTYNGPRKKPSFKYLMKLYKKHWHSEGYESEEQEKEYWESGKEMLAKYYKRYVEQGEYYPAYGIEEYFEIPMGKNAVMLGFIDRIDKHPDGTFEILDYKTEPTMRSQEAVNKDWQLLIYYWAAKTSLGFTPKKLTLLMLHFDKEISVIPDEQNSEQLFRELEKTVDEVVDGIRNSTEWPPKYNKYCKNCDFIVDCPLWRYENGTYVKTQPESTDNGSEASGATESPIEEVEDSIVEDKAHSID